MVENGYAPKTPFASIITAHYDFGGDAVTDDEKLPLEDDDGAEEQRKPQSDPFSDYINDNLSLADVPNDDQGKLPADDVMPPSKPRPSSSASSNLFDDNKDDDFDEDSTVGPRPYGLLGPPNVSRFGPTRPSRPLGSSDGKDEGPKPTSSPFGSRFGQPPTSGSGGSNGSSGWPTYSGSRSGEGNVPPRSFGSPFAAGSTPPNRPASPFGPEKPLDKLHRSSWRALQEDLAELIDKEARVIVAVLVALIILLFNLLYVDNLRLTIATQEGQITELRKQVDELRLQLQRAE